jgi:uncharacterized protein (TIGR03435 family)
MTSEENNVHEILTRHLPSAPTEHVEADCSRILERLRKEPVRMNRLGRWRRAAWISVAAGAAAAVFLLMTVNRPVAFATVESADGGLYRVTDSTNQTLSAGAKLRAGERVRSNGGSGSMIRLADASQVELRSQSELSLERVEDGVQIRLNSGGVIVNAARQKVGHLYVQTKDVRVSVVGTVFMVNAEEQGSRVAVIEGEVHVQQGATETNLRPGEQVATNPKMESLPVKEEIAWSRNAGTHTALLEQSIAQNPPEEQAAFEVTSVKPIAPGQGGAPGPRGGGGDPGGGPAPPGTCMGRVQFDPGRFAFRNATLYSMIVWAYDPNMCNLVNSEQRITGGPAWIKSDRFDVEGVIPSGASTFTNTMLPLFRPPKLQAMLRSLLADRFKLTVHRETREIPIYALTVARGGPKLQASSDASCVSPEDVSMERGSACGASVVGIPAPNQAAIRTFKWNLDQFAKLLVLGLDRPVVNRTDLPGNFDIHLEFALDRGMLQNLPVGAALIMTGPVAIHDPSRPLSSSSIFAAVQEQLGLRLEATTGPVEFLVIDRVEKPTEN